MIRLLETNVQNCVNLFRLLKNCALKAFEFPNTNIRCVTISSHILWVLAISPKKKILKNKLSFHVDMFDIVIIELMRIINIIPMKRNKRVMINHTTILQKMMMVNYCTAWKDHFFFPYIFKMILTLTYD